MAAEGPINFLDFEQPIMELEAKIEELRRLDSDVEVNINEEIGRLQKHEEDLIKSVFSSLSPWQYSQLARHPNRPHTLDYVERIITDFEEMRGDRKFADDPAIVAGIGRLQGTPVALIGHQKGRDTGARVYRNYGMPKPEGYRKALRIMKLAERFSLPLLTFIDTPGAYPGIDAEERGQGEAIARNLATMALLKTPIISVVIGEGGSGGALAIGMADRLFMLEYSTYSVISPEGCASILWKDAGKAAEAAAAMGVTAQHLHKRGLIDAIIAEPLGAAHRDHDCVAATLRETLVETLRELGKEDSNTLIEKRQEKFRSYGYFSG